MSTFNDVVFDPGSIVPNEGAPRAEVPDGGVILWSTDLEAAPENSEFLVKVHIIRDQCDFYQVALAIKTQDGIEHTRHGQGEVIAWCRGPDVSGGIAYQLSTDPGEGTGV